MTVKPPAVRSDSAIHMAAFPKFCCVTSVRRPNDSAKTGFEMSAARVLYAERHGAVSGMAAWIEVTPVSHVCNMLYVLAS